MGNGETIIDYRGALKRLGGDPGLFRDVIRLFDEDAPVLLATIRSAIDQEDFEDLQRAAHSLKGLAANFGARKAVASAQRLERLGKTRSLNHVAETLTDLENEVVRLDHALTPYRADRLRQRQMPTA